MAETVGGVKSLLLSEGPFGEEQARDLCEALARESGAHRALRDAAQQLKERIERAGEAEARRLRLRLGVAQRLLGRAREAADTLARADGSGLALFERGRALFAAAHYHEAAEAFQEAARAGYPEIACLLQRAGALRAAGDLAAAEKLLDKVADKAADSPDYLYQRGCLHADRLECDQAVELFEAALALDPGHSGALFALAYENDRHGNDEEAQALYERSLEHPPAHLGALVNLGIIYEDRGRYREALDCYRRVLDAQPNHPRARLFFEDARAASDMYYDEEAERRNDRLNQLLSTPVTDFELSVRSRNCLQKMNIYTLGDLTRITEAELLASKNFGETSLQEIREMLNTKGLRIGQLLEHEGHREPPYARQDLTPQEQAVLARPITELNLSVRARKCMARLGVNTVGDLVQRTGDELLECKNFGVTSLNEVREKLTELGLKLRGE